MIVPGRRYDTFFHLRKKCPACREIQGPHYGRVAGYATAVLIHQPVLRVQPGGRQRALRDGQRNVHAFVRGEVEPDPSVEDLVQNENAVRVRYNPFLAGYFFRADTGKPVESGNLAIVTVSQMIVVRPR